MKKKLTREKNPSYSPQSSKHPTISVCLIAKNEEKFLDQCLRSIQPLADEIIFVDTGSTDRTVEIARRYTSKIWRHPWNDSFSEARNHYLKYATGDWIFQIDADEKLLKEDIPNVIRATQDESIDAVLIQIVNITRQGNSRGVFNVERIFRNNGVIHYEGRVHNRIVGITASKVYPIRFLHYGYDPAEGDTEKKFARTVSLLNKDLADNPNNPATHHYLSCSYLSRNMYGETIEHGLQAIRLAENKHDPMLLWTHYNVSLAYYRLNDPKLAEETAMRALSLYPDHIDSHFLMIVICFDQKRWESLIAHARQYLRLLALVDADPVHFGALVSCSLSEAWNIHVLLGIARFEHGDPDFSESFQKAIEIAPEPFLAARAAGIYFTDAGFAREAKKHLDLANQLHPGDETVKNCLADLKGKIPTISCVMIVKNEAIFLEKCLISIKDWVDEIVIVDTGSEDDTVNIAQRFTDKVYFQPWEGNFSKARNDAASHATGDWIFILDGDEELVAGSGSKLREAVMSAGEADAFLATTISPFANGRKVARHNAERLFRNNGVIHYESVVHNRLVGHTTTKSSKIEIMHYGYDVDEKKAIEKFIRTTELLKQQIAAAPENPMPYHFLGTSYLARGYFQECIAESEKAIELAERFAVDNTNFLWSHYNAALSYYHLGEFDQAKRHALRTLEKLDGYMDAYYILTLVATEQGDWEAVRLQGEKFLERLAFYEANFNRAGAIVNNTMGEGASVNLLIGHACYRTGNKEQMMAYYRKAQALTTEPWQAWNQAASYHADVTNDHPMAQELLDEALRLAPMEQKIWYAEAKLASQSNNRAGELDWLTKLEQAGCRDEVVLNRLAMFLLEDGKTEDAINILTSLLANNAQNLQAFFNIGIAYKMQKNYPLASDNFMKVINLDPANPQPWCQLSEISKALGRPEEAEIFATRALALRA